MPSDQPVKLATSADVLILEGQRLARLYRPERRPHDLLVNRRKLDPCARYEPRHGGEAMRDARGGVGVEFKRRTLASNAVIAFGYDAFATNGPERIGEMLLDQRNLCLHRQFDVPQARLWATIGRDAGEYPGATLLKHQAVCAIDPDPSGCAPRPRRRRSHAANASIPPRRRYRAAPRLPATADALARSRGQTSLRGSLR